MPPRRTETATVEAPEEPTAAAEIDHQDLKTAVREVLAEIGLTPGDPATPPGEGDGEGDPSATDALPSPRKVEIDTQNAVEKLAQGLTINVNAGAKEEKADKPPEETPAQSTRLYNFLFGKDK